MAYKAVFLQLPMILCKHLHITFQVPSRYKFGSASRTGSEFQGFRPLAIACREHTAQGVPTMVCFDLFPDKMKVRHELSRNKKTQNQ